MSAVLKSFLDTTFELTIVKAKLMEPDTVRVLQGVLDNANEEDLELFAVSVRFQADESSADKDQQTFFNLVKFTNIPLASNYS